ncbi:MAG: 16S rRNA (adenine1518-N6/adenine1519-N6)-dimethyltransferase [Candidatus Poriferisodalaceae bacterium]
MTLSSRDIKDLLSSADLEPRKSLGQNFVSDPNTVRRIARLAGVGPGDQVVEIGAGLGSLTLALIETGASVTAIETDPHLVPLLKANLVAKQAVAKQDSGIQAYGRAHVVHADARELNWNEVLPDGEWTLVANLPYNVATSLVLDVLDDVPQVKRLLVMVQREAGERLVATGGDKSFGAVSIRVAMRAQGRIVGTVSPEVFHPKPKVTSVLVWLARHDESPVPRDIDETQLLALLKAGFAQRRKMLRGALRGMASSEQLEDSGIRPEARAEELRLADWVALARTTQKEI